MGAQRGHDGVETLPTVAERLFQAPASTWSIPTSSRGCAAASLSRARALIEAADLKSAELEGVLAEASEGGRWPIVFDTSPCVYRMKQFLAGRLPLHDSIEFIHDQLLPRLTLQQQSEAVAVHPCAVCARWARTDKLTAIARQCSQQVTTVDAVQCCGFAGDRGFTRPELNEYALRHLKAALPAGCAAGYSSSRTCEIGLSEMAEMPYQSILYLVEQRSR